VLEYLCDGVKVTLNYLFWEQTVQPLFTPTHINMSSSLTHAERWSLLLVAGASLAVIANTFQGDGAPLVASVAFSTLAFSMTYAFVRWSGPSFVKAGLKGKDMSKLTPKEMRVEANPQVKNMQLTVCADPRPWAQLPRPSTSLP
jgi:hypothetical protein